MSSRPMIPSGQTYHSRIFQIMPRSADAVDKWHQYGYYQCSDPGNGNRDTNLKHQFYCSRSGFLLSTIGYRIGIPVLVYKEVLEFRTKSYFR